MNPEKILHQATSYMIKVAKWVEDVREWRESQSNLSVEDADGGSNPPPPPPPPPGTGG